MHILLVLLGTLLGPNMLVRLVHTLYLRLCAIKPFIVRTNMHAHFIYFLGTLLGPKNV